MFGHVSQHSLRRSRLQLEDRPLDGAALFPLFDEAGRTRAVMLLDGQTRRIVLADWTPGLFERRWLQRHRLRLRFADLRDADASDAERLGDLWHFDPWWVLRDERYAGHEAVPALMRTNVPGYDDAVKRLGFRSDARPCVVPDHRHGRLAELPPGRRRCLHRDGAHAARRPGSRFPLWDFPGGMEAAPLLVVDRARRSRAGNRSMAAATRRLASARPSACSGSDEVACARSTSHAAPSASMQAVSTWC